MKRERVDHALRAKVQAKIHARIRAAARRQLPASAPVYWPDDRGEPEVVGSAVLIEVGATKFLLTASHVYQRYRERPLFFGGGDGLHELPRRHITSTPPGESAEDDPFDIAVAPLPVETVAQLGGSRFLPVAQMDANERTDHRPVLGSQYLLIGFPTSKQDRLRGDTISPTSMKLLVKGCDSSAYADHALNPEWHLLLDFDKKQMSMPSGPVTAPDPYGCSGGGVWSLRGVATDGSESEVLVAIAIEYTGRQRKSIVSTRIGHVFDAIHDHFPHLRSYLPRRL